MGAVGDGDFMAGHRCCLSYSSPRTQARNSLSWAVNRCGHVCLPLFVNSAALGEGHGFWGLAIYVNSLSHHGYSGAKNSLSSAGAMG